MSGSVVGAIDGEGWKRAVKIPALHCATHDHVVTSPGVIGAVAIRGVSASEIRQRERGHIGGDAHFRGRLVESAQGLVQVVEQRILLGKLTAVRIEPAHGHEKNLPLQSEGLPDLDDFSHLLQLAGEVGILGEHGRQRRSRRQCRSQGLAILNGIAGGGARRLDQRQTGIESQQALQRRQTIVRVGSAAEAI